MEDDIRIRWATEDDRMGIMDAMRDAFRGLDEFARMAEFFTSPLHASAGAHTTCIAVERSSGRVAAALITAPMTWRYGEMALKALVLLQVGTRHAFRGMGLMRRIVDHVHDWLRESDFDLSFVDGIPWYYRQFGYLPLDLMMPRVEYARHTLPDGRKQLRNLIVRPFEARDIPLTIKLLADRARGSLYSFTYDERWVRMFALDYFEENSDLSATICGQDGDPLGVILCYTKACAGRMDALALAIKPGVSYFDVAPAAIQYLIDEGDRQTGRAGGCAGVCLPYDEGIAELLRGCMSRQRLVNKRQCRLVDMRAYLLKIAPVLERRIAESILAGYTRTVNIQLYGHDSGLRIEFGSGRIADVQWQRVDYAHSAFERLGDIQIPYEKLVRLIFGVQCIDEMIGDHREVNSYDGEALDNEMRLLLKTLFPKRPSYIMGSC